MRVYIAGPITKGDLIYNIRVAIDAAERLFKLGHTPFVPHFDCFWHLIYPHTFSEWLSWDKEWLKQCHALLRLPGKSLGADREVRMARKLGISVFYSISDLQRQNKLERKYIGKI